MSQERFLALWKLSNDCQRYAEPFDEPRWLAGVTEILGYALAPGSYVLKVVH